ncbi:unnamed protein product [Closterium sp. NIES-53]
MSPRREPLSPQRLREWFSQRTCLRRATSLRGAGVNAGAGGTEGAGAAGPGGARTRETRAAGAGGVGGAGGGDTGTGGVGAGGTDTGAAGLEELELETLELEALELEALELEALKLETLELEVLALGVLDLAVLLLEALCSGDRFSFCRSRHHCRHLTGSFAGFLSHPESPLPAPSPYAEQTDSLTERLEPASRPASCVRAVRTGCRVPRPRPPPVPGTHIMALRPSSIPLQVPLPSPPASSLPNNPDPEFNLAHDVSPTVPRLLATVVTDPSFESDVASTLVSELVDFAAACRLDYATSLVESECDCPPSVGGECALGTDVLEDRQEDFECLAAAVPHLVAMLLAPEGDPDAPDIPTPCSYAEAITVPPPGANIVNGMWIFRAKKPPDSPPVFKARYAPREWHDTLRTKLLDLGFAPSTFLCTDTSLLPFYVLVYVDDLVFAIADTEALTPVKSELQKRHTCTDLGELRSYLGLQITRDRARRTITLTQSHMVHQVHQLFGFQYSSPQSTPLPTSHLLSAPPSNESVEPSGPYPELVGCLMYLMTCTRPDLAYPLSILARYVAPRRHRPEHWEAAKRVLRYLCSTSGMGLVLGGRGPVVLTGHAVTSWVDDLATQRSSQGYTFSLGSASVSWRSTRSASFLISSCEAEIYSGAMAAQELCWLTYLLTNLGEPPRSSPF